MDTATRRHHIIVGLLLFCVAIEALTLYPVFNMFMLAVPTGMFGLNHCMNALIQVTTAPPLGATRPLDRSRDVGLSAKAQRLKGQKSSVASNTDTSNDPS